jgi:hypothetical protein
MARESREKFSMLSPDKAMWEASTMRTDEVKRPVVQVR